MIGGGTWPLGEVPGGRRVSPGCGLDNAFFRQVPGHDRLRLTAVARHPGSVSKTQSAPQVQPCERVPARRRRAAVEVRAVPDGRVEPPRTGDGRLARDFVIRLLAKDGWRGRQLR